MTHRFRGYKLQEPKKYETMQDLADDMGVNLQTLYYMVKVNKTVPKKSKLDIVVIDGVEYRKPLDYNMVGFTFNYKGKPVVLKNIEKDSEGLVYTYSGNIKTYPREPYNNFNTMWVAYSRKVR